MRRSVKKKCWKCGQPVDHHHFGDWMLRMAKADPREISRWWRRRRPTRVVGTRTARMRSTGREVTIEYYEVLHPVGLPERPLAPVSHLVFKGKHWEQCKGSWKPA